MGLLRRARLLTVAALAVGAALPAAASATDLGFNALYVSSGVPPAQAAELSAAAGATVARYPLDWWSLEPERDAPDMFEWRRYDAVYESLLARGITPLFLPTSSPPWARDAEDRDCYVRRSCLYPPSEEMLGEWQQFIAYAASRYPDADFEIWNEPNYPGQWRSGLDPARYGRLLASAADALASVDPAIKVYSGGLAMTPRDGWIDPATFVEEMLAAVPESPGLGIDGIGVHLYPHGDLSASGAALSTLDAVRDSLIAAGLAEMPAYVTELGESTSGPGAVSETVQSERLLAALAALRVRPDVSGIILHTLFDRAEFPRADVEYGFGVLTEDLEPKRAFCALTAAAGAIDGRCAALPPDPLPPSPPSPPPPDTTAPAVSLDLHDGAVITASPRVVKFAADEQATFECSFDGAGFVPCSSPLSLEPGAEGAHGFALRASDAAGNVSVLERSYVTDLKLPETTLSGAPTFVTAFPLAFGLSTDEPGELRCALDSWIWAPCATTLSFASLPEGPHVLRVTSVDSAGNWDPTPAEAAFTVDTVAPVVSFGSAKARTRHVVLRFQANEPADFECRVDRRAWKACTSPLRLKGLKPGRHRLRVRATDAAGHRSTVVKRRFTVRVR
jgi:hypothetical protein